MKKKHHKKHRKRLKSVTVSVINHHHILWERRLWNSGSLRALREYYYCIVPLPKETIHKLIHEKIRNVPVPKQSYARYVLDELKKLDDVGAISDKDRIEKRLSVLICFFDCIEQETANALWEQLKIVREFYNGSSV